MLTIKQGASEFLAHRRIAVTGVSRSPQDHGANVVYRRLRERGYEAFAINPNAEQVEGDRCYPDLKSVPGGVDAVVIGTRPANRRANDARVRRSRHQARMDAPWPRCRERIAGSRRSTDVSMASR